MNIMEKLGFSKRGAEKQQSQPVNPINHVSEENPVVFTDRYQREKDETRIINLIILDESGSMNTIRQQALSGVNETIQTIRSAQQENPDDHQMISFVTFDSNYNRKEVRVIIDNERIGNVQDIKEEQYTPYGGTPLYDAMGYSITALEKVVREGDHVLVTVVTDGYENSSRRYSAGEIKELVDALTAKGWVFNYIGANQDSERVAQGLGIRCTMDFEASIKGSDMMWHKMNSSHREYYKKVRHEKETGERLDLNEDFFAEKQALTRVTPDLIENLGEGQVFVFGSDVAGRHGGGAALLAVERFGAVVGQPVGLQGRSYAIPTSGQPLESIRQSVMDFIYFADMHPEMTFLVTRIGCGAAGYSDEEIAPLFAKAYSLPNVYLPASFWKILSYRYRR